MSDIIKMILEIIEYFFDNRQHKPIRLFFDNGNGIFKFDLELLFELDIYT